MYIHTLNKYIVTKNLEGAIESVYLLITSTDGTTNLDSEINLNRKEKELLAEDPENIHKILARKIANIEEEIDSMTLNNPTSIVNTETVRKGIIEKLSRKEIEKDRKNIRKEKQDSVAVNIEITE